MRHLLIGGPAHGDERDITNGQNELIVMAPSPGNPIPSPFKYVLRDIQMETRPGVVFERQVLVESSLQVEQATQAIAAVLMQRFAEQLLVQFMEGGARVAYGKNPGQDDTSSETRATDSGLLIAKR